MHSNKYTFTYAIVISVITAIALSFASEYLKPFQEANIALDRKTQILHSVGLKTKVRNEINKIYAEQVEEMVIDGKGMLLEDLNSNQILLKEEIVKPMESRRLPLYIYTSDNNEKYYVLPVRGSGLWGPIWGYISIESDFNTIHGTTFDHKAETPGLGAEIAQEIFQDQFIGKKIMMDNSFVSVRVLKKGEKMNIGSEHIVDGITGGTITSRGTDVMLKNCIEPYLTYFKTIK